MHPIHPCPDPGQLPDDEQRPFEAIEARPRTNARGAPRHDEERARRAHRTTGHRDIGACRANLYDDVTRRIIAELEAGRVPWVQPWGSPDGASPGLPRNALTGRHYSGVNILILWGAVIEHAYPSQCWLTFKQARDAGGCVRKGEHGTTVVYADRFTPRDPKRETGGSDSPARAKRTRAPDTGDTARAIPFLKRFTVFNVAQCEGLRPGLAADTAPLPEREIVPVAEALIAASGVDFRIGGNRAFYVPSRDFVAVPPQPAFFDQINYYRTCLHELTHATGHPSRLARNLTTDFGSKDYAREELVAEMGSAFLCAALGIVPTVRHADYLGSWLTMLREDLSDDATVRGTGAPRGHAIFRAASAASKAADWLLARYTATAPEAGTAGGDDPTITPNGAVLP